MAVPSVARGLPDATAGRAGHAWQPVASSNQWTEIVKALRNCRFKQRSAAYKRDTGCGMRDLTVEVGVIQWNSMEMNFSSG